MQPRSSSSFVMAVLLLGCGVPAPRPEARQIEIHPQPPAGVRYEILHREARQIGEEAPTSIATRTLLEVTEVLPDGVRRVRARLFRNDRDEGEDVALTDEVVTFELSPTGTLLGEPERQCGESGELRLARYLRHVLGARAIVTRRVSEGGRWRGAFHSDATELPAAAVFRLDEIRRTSATGRFSAPLAIEEGDIGVARVTGEGRVRGRFTVSLEDGFRGTTELRTRIAGTVRTEGAERRAVVEARSIIRVRRAAGTEALSLSCDFDPALVTGVIREHLRAFQTCYERELVADPELNGRVLLRFEVQASGRFTNATATEDSMGRESLTTCLTAAVESLRVSPGPFQGPIFFAYPFVFAPQN